MKKLMMVCIAGLLVFSLAGTVLAFDEEEKDIRKRHENWLGKVMTAQNNREQVNAENKAQKEDNGYIYTYVTADLPEYDLEIPERGNTNPPAYIEEARKVIADQIGVNWHAVKIEETVGLTPSNMMAGGLGFTKVYFGKTILAILKHGNDEYYVEIKEDLSLPGHSNFTYTTLDPGDPRVGVGKTILTLRDQMGSSYGLIYKGYMQNEDGSISINFLDSNNGFQWVEMKAKYDTETGTWNMKLPYIEDCKYETFERKEIEAQIALKGNGENYTFSGQMADQPKEAVPLQKKQ